MVSFSHCPADLSPFIFLLKLLTQFLSSIKEKNLFMRNRPNLLTGHLQETTFRYILFTLKITSKHIYSSVKSKGSICYL